MWRSLLALTGAILLELMGQKPNIMHLGKNGRRELSANINYLFKESLQRRNKKN